MSRFHGAVLGFPSPSWIAVVEMVKNVGAGASSFMAHGGCVFWRGGDGVECSGCCRWFVNDAALAVCGGHAWIQWSLAFWFTSDGGPLLHWLLL
ncbi:hypothetical protein DEO72_LG11g1452 [Vigna unguiculata]|uniref:Uncharacterized protein n=1 Tax=Vigna unguiculata TaxID=3917 RepID=A0A4D6NN63_VIGUN|nr:hypothetical protein DEO72_LG11g1452 [Vigna unguiculata]